MMWRIAYEDRPEGAPWAILLTRASQNKPEKEEEEGDMKTKSNDRIRRLVEGAAGACARDANRAEAVTARIEGSMAEVEAAVAAIREAESRAINAIDKAVVVLEAWRSAKQEDLTDLRRATEAALGAFQAAVVTELAAVAGMEIEIAGQLVETRAVFAEAKAAVDAAKDVASVAFAKRSEERQVVDAAVAACRASAGIANDACRRLAEQQPLPPPRPEVVAIPPEAVVTEPEASTDADHFGVG